MSKKIETLAQLDALQRYTIDEACAYLRASRARVYAKVKAGQLSIIKDGRRSYVAGSEIIRASQA
jgi:excisionase family DNA binding protein